MFVVLVLGLTTTVANADIGDGLLAYWPLDEGEGTTTADLSANNNPGTFVDAPEWVDGKFGGALDFDGSDDAVNCGNPPVLDFGTGDFTISLWVNVGNSDNDEAIFGKGDRGGTCYFLKIRDSADNGDIKLRLDDGSTQKDPDTDDHPDLYTAPGWHHLVAMRRNSIKIHVFVDGADDQGVAGHGDSNLSAGYDLSATSLHNAYIGAIEDTPLGRFFDGSIDDVAVWNRALTDDEVAYLWNDGEGNPAGSGNPVRIATDPDPAHESRTAATGQVEGDYYMLLLFEAGYGATTHTAYFSTVEQEVIDRNPAVNLGSPPYPGMYPTGYYAGLVDPCVPEFAHTPMQRGTTYYWVVDESNDTSTYPGDVWNYTIASELAWNPTPADDAEYVGGDPNVDLSWQLGDINPDDYIISYDVFYGTDETTVATATTPDERPRTTM